MMTKKLVVLILTLILLVPVAAWGADPKAPAGPPAPSASSSPQASASSQQPQSERPQPPARQREYQRETRSHYRSGISKKEKLFLGAVVGTSMGIGAIAGGGEGLAIGAIVGGWAAYGAHRFWRWLK